jgi:hypothetical protein
MNQLGQNRMEVMRDMLQLNSSGHCVLIGTVKHPDPKVEILYYGTIFLNLAIPYVVKHFTVTSKKEIMLN